MERYNPESGLVFRETIFRSSPRIQEDLRWEYKCIARKPKYAPPLRGAESLYAKAMREIVLKAHTLSPEILQAVPPMIVLQIWKAIRRENRESLRIWRVFVKSGVGDRTFTHSTPLVQENLSQPLVNYFLEITSTSFAWATNVSIIDFPCSCADLKQLSMLVNLRKLQIGYYTNCNSVVFDDKVLEYWAISAQNRAAFRFLEMLVVINTRGISSTSFQWLNHFPALEAFILYRTAIKRRHERFAEQYGWSMHLCAGSSSFKKAQQLTLTHGNSNIGASSGFDELWKDYVPNYRSQHPRYDDLPVLSAEFAGVARNTAHMAIVHYSDLDNVLSFERRREWKGQAFQSNSTAETSLSKHAQANKKRKLKNGRALQLDKLFEEF